jgi:hypothetical protein
MKNRMEVKTPVFKGQNRNPARLIGTADGYVDAAEVVAVNSGVEQVETVSDSTGDKNAQPKARTGNMFTVLTLRGGAKVLVMGTAKSVQANVEKAMGQASPPPAEATDGNGTPAEKTA